MESEKRKEGRERAYAVVIGHRGASKRQLMCRRGPVSPRRRPLCLCSSSFESVHKPCIMPKRVYIRERAQVYITRRLSLSLSPWEAGPEFSISPTRAPIVKDNAKSSLPRQCGPFFTKIEAILWHTRDINGFVMHYTPPVLFPHGRLNYIPRDYYKSRM